ncbi:MAG: hypothetical protein WCI73_18800, partial [Phycisphaerae bacterium]
LDVLLLYVLVISVIVGPWLVLQLLPLRLRVKPYRQASHVLIGFFQAILILETFAPRLRPGSVGLWGFDYIVMLLIPIAAIIAGRFTRSFTPLFLFGSLSAMIFIGAYVSADMELAWWLSHEEITLPGIITGWIAFVLASGFGSWLLACLAGWSRHSKQNG